MVRAFSLPSESLSYFVGFTLLHSDHVIIVSPWLSDVPLRLPVNDRFDDREMRLLTMLEDLETPNVQLLVREGERHNDYIEQRLPNDIHFQRIEDLHAKAVICDDFVYLGSANITQGGLSLNREICEVLENEYGSAQEYLSRTLDLQIEG